MTIYNRKDARSSLDTALSAISQFQTGYAYFPATLDGSSPIYSITGASVWDGNSHPADQNLFEFLVTVWVKRNDGANDPGAVEDLMDDLIQDVLQAVDTWSNGFLVEPTAGSIDDIDGDQWRIEHMLIGVNWDE